MPLPFVIAGLVAAAVATVAVKAFSDDDKPSGSDNSSDGDEDERGHRESADKERRARARIQKKQVMQDEFQEEGVALGKCLAQALPSALAEAKLRRAVTLDFDLKKSSMQFDMEEAFQRDVQLLAIIDSLETILTKRASHQKTIENLGIFSALYKPKFQYGADLHAMEKRTVRIDSHLNKLKEVKSQLTKLKNETTSAQT